MSHHPTSYVGFDQIISQIEKKFFLKGFSLNLMVLGENKIGKKTLINSLFQSKINKEALLIENQIKLKLNITEFVINNKINNSTSSDEIVKFIKEKYSNHLRQELTPERREIEDKRIHLVLYFINPKGKKINKKV